MGAAARLWHLEGRGRGRPSRDRAGVSGLAERLGGQPALSAAPCLCQGRSGDGVMGWNGCHILRSVESSKAGDLSPLPPAPALCTRPGWGSEHGGGGGRRLQQAPSGSSLLRPWAHPHLALCDGVPHVAGWSPALGAAATGGGDWMPGEPVPPKVRLVSRCKSEVDTQNKPP